jgi:hypothetical protein
MINRLREPKPGTGLPNEERWRGFRCSFRPGAQRGFSEPPVASERADCVPVGGEEDVAG